MTHSHPKPAISEASIRKLAHEIWEAEGRPDDRQLRHWHRAEQMLREAEADRQRRLAEEPEL